MTEAANVSSSGCCSPWPLASHRARQPRARHRPEEEVGDDRGWVLRGDPHCAHRRRASRRRHSGPAIDDDRDGPSPASGSPAAPSSTLPVAAAEPPLRTPVDVLTRIQPPYIGQPAPFGSEIAFLDLPRIVGVQTSDLPPDVGLLLVDPVSTKLTELTRLPTPAFNETQHIWPCWQLSATSGVPGAGVPPSLYWSSDDPGYGGLIADGLTGMTLGGRRAKSFRRAR